MSTALAEPEVIPNPVGEADPPDHLACCNPVLALCGYQFDPAEDEYHAADCGHPVCLICGAASETGGPCASPTCPRRVAR